MKSYGRDTDASNPSNWGLKKNGGLFLNAAIHDYDLARYIFNKEVLKLSASGAALVYKDLKKVQDIDTCSTTLFIDGGSMAITEWSRYATYGYDVELEIICTEGSVRMGRENTPKLELLRTNLDAPTVFEIFGDAFKAEIEGFIDAIIHKTPMTPGIEDARIALQLALMARSSFQNNSTIVKVPKLRPII
jgi:predicted dehydrogenase